MNKIKVLPENLASDPQFRERFQHYQQTRGFVPNSILTMSRRPAIAQAFMDLNKAVLYEGTVVAVVSGGNIDLTRFAALTADPDAAPDARGSRE